MSAKQAINNKLQGSVAAYLRRGGVVNNQIKKGLLLSLRVKKKLKSVNIWQSYKQERDCLVHFLHLLAVCWPGAQSAWDNHALACDFCQIFTDFSKDATKQTFHTKKSSVAWHISQLYQQWVDRALLHT